MTAYLFPSSEYLTNKWWHRLAQVIFLCLTAFALFTSVMPIVWFYESPSSYQDEDYILKSIIFSSAAILSPFAITIAYRFILFISFGSSWKNTPSAESQQGNEKRKTNESKIFKGESMDSYSVADELSKWARLRDDGVVSEKEFQEARSKILQSQ